MGLTNPRLVLPTAGALSTFPGEKQGTTRKREMNKNATRDVTSDLPFKHEGRKIPSLMF